MVRDWLSEINVMSLIGTRRIDRFAGTTIDAAIGARIEAKARHPVPAISGRVPVTDDERGLSPQKLHHMDALSHDL